MDLQPEQLEEVKQPEQQPVQQDKEQWQNAFGNKPSEPDAATKHWIDTFK